MGVNQNARTPLQPQPLNKISSDSTGNRNIPVNYRNVLSQVLWPSSFTAAVPTGTVWKKLNCAAAGSFCKEIRTY